MHCANGHIALPLTFHQKERVVLELETCKGGLDLARKDGWSPVKAKVNTLLQYEAAPWLKALAKAGCCEAQKMLTC